MLLVIREGTDHFSILASSAQKLALVEDQKSRNNWLNNGRPFQLLLTLEALLNPVASSCKKP
jgi:hypothetical protein